MPVDNDDPTEVRPEEGRGKHIGDLLLPFYHRGACWQDWGTFLDELFKGNLHVKKSNHLGFHDQQCRHHPVVGQHRAVMDEARGPKSEQYPTLAHHRFGRPCRAFGAGEINKTPGFVVADTVVKAKAFLKQVGKGGKLEDIAYDEGGDSDWHSTGESSKYESAGSSQVQDSQGEIDARNIIDDPMELVFGGESQETDYGSVVSLADIEVMMGSPEGRTTGVPTPPAQSGHGSMALRQGGSENPAIHDNELEVADVSGSSFDPSTMVRKSTKVRAATLGYLQQFSTDPVRLREETLRLASGTECVLHLCGCGMPYKNQAGTLVPGCCESTHLKLGTVEENTAHRFFHIVINQCRAEDYADLLSIYHRVQFGKGLF